MMKQIFAALILATLALPAQADEAERRAAAEAYVALPDVQSMMDEMMSARTLASNLAASLPPNVNATPAQIASIGAIMEEAMRPVRPELERAMVSSSVKNFTTEEILALTAFYQSPVGASVMSKMQPFMQDAMTAIAPSMQRLQQTVLPQIIEILQGQ